MTSLKNNNKHDDRIKKVSITNTLDTNNTNSIDTNKTTNNDKINTTNKTNITNKKNNNNNVNSTTKPYIYTDLCYNKIDLMSLYNKICFSNCGAISSFIGITRDNFNNKIVLSLSYGEFFSYQLY